MNPLFLNSFVNALRKCPTRAAAGRCPAPAIFSRKNGVKALSRCGGERVLPYPFLPAAPARQKDGGRGRSAAVCLMNVLSVFIFGFVIGLFYLKNLLLILTFYTISYLFAGIPVFLLAILLGTLPVKINTISTVANIGLFGMGWLSILRNDTHSILGEIVYGLNPIDYVSQVLLTINQAFRNAASVASYQILAVLILLIIFGGIGIGSISKVRLNSLNMRN